MATIYKHWILALFWALVHALSAHRAWKSKSFIDFVTLIIMSSFTWVIFTLIALHLFPASPYLVYAMSGTWGYLGIEGMGMIVEFIKKRFNIK